MSSSPETGCVKEIDDAQRSRLEDEEDEEEEEDEDEDQGVAVLAVAVAVAAFLLLSSRSLVAFGILFLVEACFS